MESLGRYRILKRIGSGGMAQVFLCRARGAQGTEKLLVIKQVHPSLARNLKFIEMFVDEARVAMRLNHTNIVQVYAFEQIGEHHVLAMEYVDGSDLLQLMRAARQAKRRIPHGIAAFIAAEVAKGLGYAHSRTDDSGVPLEIVHRDVSPQNILISRDGAAKIADFGIARARWLHEEAEGVKGKLGYMPPEQAAGKAVDHRADIFSLGVVLCEMLIGRPLADGGASVSQKLERALNPAHPTPREVDPSIPEELDRIVARAMAHRPEDRFESARELAQALTRYLHSLPEIHDAQALEGWIAELVPDESPGVDDDTASIGTALETTARARRPVAEPPSDTFSDGPRRTLGEVEQRPTVVVSASFVVEDGAPAADTLGRLRRLVDEIAYKADGVLREAGGVLRVFLGLAGSSPEDGGRAIRLASDVLDAAAGLSRDQGVEIRPRLSAVRGQVRARREGDGLSPDFAPDPGLISLADALIELAGAGELVVDDGVFRLTRREYTYGEPLPVGAELNVPVDEERIFGHRMLRIKSRDERNEEASRLSGFVGRDQEIARLREVLDRVRDGRLTILRLTGETGIGKTALVARLLRDPRATGQLRAVSTECLFAERDRPLSAVAAVIRELLQLEERFDPGDLDRPLAEILGGAPIYLARQRRFFERFLVDPEALWSGGYAGGRRELVRRAAFGLGVLLDLVARRTPLVLVVDGAHWMDQASIDVLAELAVLRAEAPILALLVGLPQTLADRQVVGIETFELPELPAEAMLHIVTDRLGNDDGIRPVVEQIVARAQGNPFFALEIVDSLLERGLISPIPVEGVTRYRQTRPGQIRLPATVEGVAAGRIDELDPAQRTVLRAASAIGASFTPQTVARLVDRDPREEIEGLVAARLLIRMAAPEPGQVAALRFAHPVVREAAYAGLPPLDRQRIHRELAQQLIESEERGGAAEAVRIAWHLDRSGDGVRAGGYYLKASEAALSVYSARQALKLLDRAIGLLEAGSEERFQAIARREQVLAFLGRHREREEDIAEMERFAQASGDDALQASAANRRAQLHFDVGRFDDAAEAIGLALGAAARSAAVEQQVEALRLLAYIAQENGHLIRSLDCCDRALAIAPAGPEGAYLRARALGIRGYVRQNMGLLDQAAVDLAEALVLFRKQARRADESQVMSNLALLAQARGELTEASGFLKSAMHLDSRMRNVSALGRKLATLASFRAEIGEFDKAERNLIDARAICRENREAVGEAETELVLADLRLSQGRREEARALLERIAGWEIIKRSRLLLVWHRQLTADALIAAALPGLGRQAAEEATRVAFDIGLHGEAVHGGVRQGLALAHLDLPGEAQSASRRATDRLLDLGTVRRAEQVWWIQARTFALLGSRPRAEAALERARRELARKRQLIAEPRLQRLFEAHPMVREIERGFGA